MSAGISRGTAPPRSPSAASGRDRAGVAQLVHHRPGDLLARLDLAGAEHVGPAADLAAPVVRGGVLLPPPAAARQRLEAGGTQGLGDHLRLLGGAEGRPEGRTSELKLTNAQLVI